MAASKLTPERVEGQDGGSCHEEALNTTDVNYSGVIRSGEMSGG
jgi:hypothetical protein